MAAHEAAANLDFALARVPIPDTQTYRLGSGDHCIMLARSASKVYDRIGPQVFLFVGLVLTAGWIGLLGYGFLTLVGY
jgi:hypothetical protein